MYYFRLLAVNGEGILGSEGYRSKSGCRNGIESVKANAPIDDRYEQNTSSTGEFYFTLYAANGEPIGNSGMYSSKVGRNNGIKAVKSTAPNAVIEDLT